MFHMPHRQNWSRFSRPWVLPFCAQQSVSLTSGTRPAVVAKWYVTSQTFFCSSLGKNEPTCPRSSNSERKHTSFVWILIEQLNEVDRFKYLSRLLLFQPDFPFRFFFPFKYLRLRGMVCYSGQKPYVAGVYVRCWVFWTSMHAVFYNSPDRSDARTLPNWQFCSSTVVEVLIIVRWLFGLLMRLLFLLGLVDAARSSYSRTGTFVVFATMNDVIKVTK